MSWAIYDSLIFSSIASHSYSIIWHPRFSSWLLISPPAFHSVSWSSPQTSSKCSTSLDLPQSLLVRFASWVLVFSSRMESQAALSMGVLVTVLEWMLKRKGLHRWGITFFWLYSPAFALRGLSTLWHWFFHWWWVAGTNILCFFFLGFKVYK